MKVTIADFIRNYGTLADKALSEPVTITKNGRDRLAILSAEEYARLKRRDRRVVRLEEFTDEEMALIAKAGVPDEQSHFDDELKDWRRLSSRPQIKTAARTQFFSFNFTNNLICTDASSARRFIRRYSPARVSSKEQSIFAWRCCLRAAGARDHPAT